MKIKDFLRESFLTFGRTFFGFFFFSILMYALFLGLYAAAARLVPAQYFAACAGGVFAIFVFLNITAFMILPNAALTGEDEEALAVLSPVALLRAALNKLPVFLTTALIMSAPVSLVSLSLYLTGFRSVSVFLLVNAVNALLLLFTAVFAMPYVILQDKNPVIAFGSSAALTFKNFFKVLLGLITAHIIACAISFPAGIPSAVLLGFASASGNIYFIIGAGALMWLVLFSLIYLYMCFYTSMFIILTKPAAQAAAAPEVKTSTHTVSSHLEDLLATGSERDQILSDIEGMNEGEIKREHSFFNAIEHTAGGVDEMPTLVFDEANEEEMRKLAELDPRLKAWQDRNPEVTDSTIAPSSHELDVERESIDRTQKLIPPPPPPMKKPD